jgi:MCM AAA-lid domain
MPVRVGHTAPRSPQARVKLVEAFKALRSGDAIPGSGSVYRITVRQLEALIRLSEALARLALRTEVLPADVREAQRLIKASVHSAGDADVEMELPEDQGEADDVARLWLGGGGEEAAAGDDAAMVDGLGAALHAALENVCLLDTEQVCSWPVANAVPACHHAQQSHECTQDKQTAALGGGAFAR